MSDNDTKTKQVQAEISALQDKLTQLQDCSENPNPVLEAAKDVKDIAISYKERRRLDCKVKLSDVAWNKDNRRLAAASQDGTLVVWDVMTKQKDYFIFKPCAWYMCCDFSPNGEQLTVAGLDNCASVHNIPAANTEHDGGANDKPVANLAKHTGYIGSIKWLDNETIVTGSGDCSAIVWDVAKSAPIQVLNDHSGDVAGMDAKDSNVFVTCSTDKTAKMWDRRVGGTCCTMTFPGNLKSVNKVKFLNNYNNFVTAGEDGIVRLFDNRCNRQVCAYDIAADEEPPEEEEGDVENIPCNAIDVSSSGRVIFSGYEDGALVAWDTLTGAVIQELRPHSEKITSIATSPDGKAFAMASRDMFVSVWA